MIRTFDVAFDGYNGGLDDSWSGTTRVDPALHTGDVRPHSAVQRAEHAGDGAAPHRRPALVPEPYRVSHGHGATRALTRRRRVSSGSQRIRVFNSTNARASARGRRSRSTGNMNRLGMFQWASVDQSSRPAGEACIANEASSNMLAFQGTMNMYDKQGNARGAVMGSGHLGPSYVGVASVREGRGILNTHMQPQMIRQI